jgi:hypothetical protein
VPRRLFSSAPGEPQRHEQLNGKLIRGPAPDRPRHEICGPHGRSFKRNRVQQPGTARRQAPDRASPPRPRMLGASLTKGSTMNHWIVIADAAGARIFSMSAHERPLVLVRSLENADGRLRTQDLTTDAGGRVSKAGAPGTRSAMGPKTTAHDEAAAQFAHALVGLLQEEGPRARSRRSGSSRRRTSSGRCGRCWASSWSSTCAGRSTATWSTWPTTTCGHTCTSCSRQACSTEGPSVGAESRVAAVDRRRPLTRRSGELPSCGGAPGRQPVVSIRWLEVIRHSTAQFDDDGVRATVGRGEAWRITAEWALGN